MKTAREWFEQLPEPIRSEAMENAENLNAHHLSLREAINNQFWWIETSQGFDYWRGIYINAAKGNYDKPTHET